MTHEEVVARLAQLAGPIGPWGTQEGAERLVAELVAGEPHVAASRLLDAVVSGAPLPSDVPVTWPAVEYEASELLARLGEDPAARSLLVRALDDAGTRQMVLRALAFLAEPATGAALAALAERHLSVPFLTEEELVHLASALGSVGGPHALAALGALRGRTGAPIAEREVEIALKGLGAGRGQIDGADGRS